MSIQVNQFVWKPGENDAEYIRLLERSNDDVNKLLLRAIGKLARMAKTHAKVVHGQWVKMTGAMPPELTGHYECSKCLWHAKLLYERGFNYCPNCGAKMDGDGDG